MSDYPIHIITAYKGGEISRQQFTHQISDWQKSRGIDFDSKGTVDKFGVHLTYRGVRATIRNGTLCFITDAEGNTRHVRERVATPFEFRRKVDFALYRRLRGEWN